MCLVILSFGHAPRETKETLSAAYEVNNDGIGFSFNYHNQIITQKGFESFDKFYEDYLKIPVESSILIHFRKSSAGALINENLHPFIVNENLVFAYNGTLSDLVFKESDKSDTFIFNDIIVKKLSDLNKDFYKDSAIKRLLNSYLKNDKMVMLDNTGEFTIFNEVCGHWKDETKTTWYSNKIWEKKIKKNAQFLPPVRPHTFHNTHTIQLCDPKKIYYKYGDEFYRKLSEDELNEISKANRGWGVKKLLKHYKIAKLNHVSDEKRLEGYWKYLNLKLKTEEKSQNPAILETTINQETQIINPVIKKEFDVSKLNRFFEEVEKQKTTNPILPPI